MPGGLRACKATKKLERLVEQQLKDHGVEDVPDVVLMEPRSTPPPLTCATRDRRDAQGSCGARISRPRQTAANQQHSAFLEQKAVAIAQVLHAWGLMDSLSFEDQERLVHDILEIATAEVEQ